MWTQRCSSQKYPCRPVNSVNLVNFVKKCPKIPQFLSTRLQFASVYGILQFRGLLLFTFNVFRPMKRLMFSIALFAFIAVGFLSIPPAPAQERQGGGFGLVQADYEEYARLFQRGREPSLSPHPVSGNPRWRALYRNHRWAEFAEGGEFREPMLAAQTLVGIYLVQHVDHQLTHHIQSIILSRSQISARLAERITLDRIADYWESVTTGSDESLHDPVLQDRMGAAGGDDFYTDEELDRMARQRRDIDRMARERMIPRNALATRYQMEIRSVENLFDHGESGWVPTYYFMGEKFRVLDELAASFTFNWDSERREAELAKRAENIDPVLQRRIEREVRDQFLPLRNAARGVPAAGGSSMPGMGGLDNTFGGGGFEEMGGEFGGMDPSMMGMMSSMSTGSGMSEQQIEELEQNERERRLRDAVEDDLRRQELRERAYKYVVGVYESSDYHLRTLRRIYRYFRNAADAGDPIAQYHLALFLRFLGEIVDPFADPADHIAESNKLLSELRTQGAIQGRMEALSSQLAREESIAPRRMNSMTRKLEALVNVENDKIDRFDEVLMRVRARISSGSGVSGRMGGSGGMGGGSSGSMMGGSSSEGSSSGSNSSSGGGF